MAGIAKAEGKATGVGICWGAIEIFPSIQNHLFSRHYSGDIPMQIYDIVCRSCNKNSEVLRRLIDRGLRGCKQLHPLLFPKRKMGALGNWS